MELKAIAHLGRFRDIIAILFKYGLDDVVERLQLPGKIIVEKIRSIDPEMSTWERVRHALEELGPTFIKLGQIMSLRPDVLPLPLILELEKLQDKVAPVSFPKIQKVVEKSFRRPLYEIFSIFEEHPAAAASLAQVHRAILRDSNQPVAVKVQRPDIHSIVQTDIYILETVARRLESRVETVKPYNPVGLVGEFKRSLLRELDFGREARNMRIARSNFEGNRHVYIPQVYEEYSNENVLTMELIRGVRLKNLPPDGLVDRKLLATEGLRATIKQILEDGFFHADPHPGNMLIMDNNVLVLLDWGIVGRLTQETRFDLVDLITSLVDKDSGRAVDILLNFTGGNAENVNERRLQRDLLDILDSYESIPLGKLNVGRLMLEINAMLREFRLRVPTDMALMIKALVTMEGAARQLCPELDVIGEAESHLKKLAIERWKPTAIWHKLRRTLYHLSILQEQLPKQIKHIVQKIELGEINVHFLHENLDELRHTLENITNRLTTGIIIAAMIIGSSIVMNTGFSPYLFGYPALGVIGYIASGALGFWMVINIIRSRKF